MDWDEKKWPGVVWSGERDWGTWVIAVDGGLGNLVWGYEIGHLKVQPGVPGMLVEGRSPNE